MEQNKAQQPSLIEQWKNPTDRRAKFRVLAITPCEYPDTSLAQVFWRHEAAAAIDIGRDTSRWPSLFAQLEKMRSPHIGIRITDHIEITPSQLPTSVNFVILDSSANIAQWAARFVTLVQVTSIVQARAAIKAGAHALIAKGQESGGLVGDESSFILLQRVLALPELTIPVWSQGGIGLHTAAAAIAGGAHGVVLDSQLALLNESTLNTDIKQAVRAMDGSETRLLGGYQLYNRPGLPIAEHSELDAATVRERMGNSNLQHFLPLGQDAALAKPLALQCPNVEALLHSFRSSIAAHISQAQALQSLAENGPLARAHGTRFPIAQGPMTRVSDTAAFANAVAENGALPFLALSLMNAEASRKLIEETRARIGAKTWGVGVLGFADAEILNPQLELIREFKPAVVLLAGGRPSQARPLNELGITTYLHVPSPGLLELFLKDGARHFVFEGRECGGHVGPRYSFVLWEQQLQLLLNFEQPEQLHILFAGGIHDERSAAMIAVMAAPLAARGAKIGVLMGTAYIATREAVECGAIISNFQQQAVGSDQTVLIETAPGHAVRCLQSHFVQQFNEEKIRLQTRGFDQQEIWKQLEELNIGRLRIATKGVERRGNSLQTVDQQQQHHAGMYMIGQLIALRNKVGSMIDLHQSVSTGATEFLQAVELPVLQRAKNAEPIAIVGMECIYPGSPDLETFWANILAGKDLVKEIPAERWNKTVYYREGETQKGKSPSKWGGFIDAVAFDPLEYGIPPQSLAAIEPVQLLSLEVAKRALRDAGYGEQQNALGSQKSFDKEKTSVIFGAESGMDLANSYAFRNLYQHYLGEIPPELDAVLPDLTEDSFPGVLVNVISGRIANRLGLSGVNYSVDSACASSLTAIELAVKELRAGSSDMVLAGGADFHNSINDFLMFASVGALSSSGRCRSFDNSADGICLGEGVGIVVLKRLEDAQRDGDRIYAVIDGIAGSSDGKGLGLTAPRKEGQKRALERAYWQAGVLPAEIGLVEAHGTGTVVGDKTELQTMTEIFSAGGALPAQVGLGSVKSQIGHTKCAAGIAGLIKISKALYHRVLPPTLHIETPNSAYHAQSSPFTLNKTARPWFERNSEAHITRRAAVSAFGFGGANFHAVLSNYTPEVAHSGGGYWQAELFVFRGDNFAATQQHMRRFVEFLQGSDAPLSLRDLSYSAGRGDAAVQCAFVARDREDLAAKLLLAIGRADNAEIFYRDAKQLNDAGKIAFLFPGQGSQTPNMLSDLFVAFPQLHYLLEMDSSCAEILFPPTAYDREEKQAQQRAITDTRVAQPALGMVEFAAIELLKALGIVPAMAGGHSYGELVALASAGSFDAKTLLTLSRQRGESILAATGSDPGKMVAVSCGYAQLKELFPTSSGVVLANQNSNAQTVISGPTAAIEAALALLKEKNITAKAIETACAFHSPVVARAQPLFERALQDVSIAKPSYPVYSNTTTRPYQHDSDAIKHQLAQHVVSPVRFVEQIEAMYADGARVFVEVGPKRVLSGLIGNILSAKPHRMITLDNPKQNGIGAFLSAVAQLAVIGETIDLSILYAGRAPQLLDIDTPRKLSATCWMIDGGRAWPIRGKAPAYAGKPITEPLQLARGTLVASADSVQETAVIDYLTNMRESVRAQRDVLLGFLGQTPAPMSAAQPLMRVAATPIVNKTLLIDAQPVEVVSTPVLDDKEADVQATLLAIVSDRTGYPSEMLDLDLDLEADLSIDSIKRVEVIGELAARLHFRQTHGAGVDALLEQLSAKKNLRAIIDWLKQSEPASSHKVAKASLAVVEAVLEEKAAATHDVPAVLMAIVSERTGYPTEMLDLDLDLEADLSIDSIKRVEIIGELAARLHFRETRGAGVDALLEQLSAKKNLRAIIDWLKQSDPSSNNSVSKKLVSDSSAKSESTTESAIAVLSATESSIPLTRYILQSIPAPRVAIADNRVAGKHFLITNDSFGIAQMLAERLCARGANARIVDFSEGEAAPDLQAVDGLIHLWGLNPANRVRDVKRFFALVRDAVQKDVRYVLAISGIGGDFGRHVPNEAETLADFGCGAGLAGLIKSLGKEHPGVQAQWIDLDLREPAAALVAHLETELLAENKFAEIGYRSGVRMLRRCVPIKLPPTHAELDLNADSVVLLTGGARGITAQLAIELAQRYRCTLELVGRSVFPLDQEAAHTIAALDTKALRQVIITTEPNLKPADVEKRCAKILAERDMRATIAAIEAAGARVNYTALDVRNIDDFGAFIQQMYARYNRIDGVIHGAGVIEDKLLRDKSTESFDRVFDTKVRGALMLYNLLRHDVKFVVFFSSVASAFGNRGQIDYAAANDVLDKMAPALQARIGGRVLSVNWGPWAGTGMVSPQLERDYASKGIGLIPLRAGVEALLNELARNDYETTQVVLMCGAPESFGAETFSNEVISTESAADENTTQSFDSVTIESVVGLGR
jgi:acyl transferase domain-containing protein/NAD(P)H-dependent flavin oxidoreductase YrpB (nitropropane dioxygenase family)/NAD(P)-dependent dehydrogenase (short-subunit alcohol dehydrogenase family)